jgi:ubiquinone/menaquinone biosynthesis C-methylase UbiE
MFPWIIIGIALIFIVVFFSLAIARIHAPRKPGFEGIESPEVVRAFDRISRWPQFRLLRWLVLREISIYRPEGSIVDIGCGPGYLIKLITRKFPALDVTGIDVSEEILATARGHLKSIPQGNRVKFIPGDIQKLPLKNDSVDFVVSTLSLHHWAEPVTAMREIQRVLIPGGQFLVFDLRRNPHRFFYWIIKFATRCVVPVALREVREPLGSVLASYTPDEVGEIITGAGFANWKVKPGFAWLFMWGKKG